MISAMEDAQAAVDAWCDVNGRDRFDLDLLGAVRVHMWKHLLVCRGDSGQKVWVRRSPTADDGKGVEYARAHIGQPWTSAPYGSQDA